MRGMVQPYTITNRLTKQVTTVSEHNLDLPERHAEYRNRYRFGVAERSKVLRSSPPIGYCVQYFGFG
jgi:hypothetical protein